MKSFIRTFRNGNQVPFMSRTFVFLCLLFFFFQNSLIKTVQSDCPPTTLQYEEKSLRCSNVLVCMNVSKCFKALRITTPES